MGSIPNWTIGKLLRGQETTAKNTWMPVFNEKAADAKAEAWAKANGAELPQLSGEHNASFNDELVSPAEAFAPRKIKRGVLPKRRVILPRGFICRQCRKSDEGPKGKKFCSDGCRKQAHKARIIQ